MPPSPTHLSPEQIEAFRRDGFVAVRGFDIEREPGKTYIFRV